jgi:hypothetical protein
VAEAIALYRDTVGHVAEPEARPMQQSRRVGVDGRTAGSGTRSEEAHDLVTALYEGAQRGAANRSGRA